MKSHSKINKIIKTMNNFNAEQARSIVGLSYNKELDKILSSIKYEAEQGRSVLYVNESLNYKTKQVLINRGFKISDLPSIVIMIDGAYHSIHW